MKFYSMFLFIFLLFLFFLFFFALLSGTILNFYNYVLDYFRAVLNRYLNLVTVKVCLVEYKDKDSRDFDSSKGEDFYEEFILTHYLIIFYSSYIKTRCKWIGDFFRCDNYFCMFFIHNVLLPLKRVFIFHYEVLEAFLFYTGFILYVFYEIISLVLKFDYTFYIKQICNLFYSTLVSYLYYYKDLYNFAVQNRLIFPFPVYFFSVLFLPFWIYLIYLLFELPVYLIFYKLDLIEGFVYALFVLVNGGIYDVLRICYLRSKRISFFLDKLNVKHYPFNDKITSLYLKFILHLNLIFFFFYFLHFLPKDIFFVVCVLGIIIYIQLIFDPINIIDLFLLIITFPVWFYFYYYFFLFFYQHQMVSFVLWPEAFLMISLMSELFAYFIVEDIRNTRFFYSIVIFYLLIVIFTLYFALYLI